MEIKITKKDVIWSYIAQVFTLASGFFTLPLILNKLSADEIGFNYILLTIGSMIYIFDFGLSAQFGRNLTYVLSGAKHLCKDGLDEQCGGDIDNHLLAVIIETAKFIYKRLSLLASLLLITFGTVYIYQVTDGFNTVPLSLTIWGVYIISVYFNIYFLYYSALLNGAALIMESKKAMLYSRVFYVVLCYILLLLDFGLLGVVIANLLSPFVARYYSYVFFYTEDMLSRLKGQFVSAGEKKEAFFVLWYNAKKLGVNFIGAYVITQSGMFLAGLFLPINEVGSYGLMIQLFSITSAFASGLFNTYLPKFNNYFSINDRESLIRVFSFTMIGYYLIVCLGGIFILLLGPFALRIIGSDVVLPSVWVMVFYFINLILNGNHTYFMNIIVASNKVPFVIPTLLTGLGIFITNYLVLNYSHWGLMGIVCTTLACQGVYNHWRWPKWVLDDFNLSFFVFCKIGYREFRLRVSQFIVKLNMSC